MGLLTEIEKAAYSHTSLVDYGDVTVGEEVWDMDGLLKAHLSKITEVVGGARLTDEEIEMNKGYYTAPTKEEWRVKPDHQYRQDKRIANAQLGKIKDAIKENTNE